MKNRILLLLVSLTFLLCNCITTNISREELENFRKKYQYLKNVPAPDFELIDKNDKIVQLNNFKNSLIILDFWSTGCGASVADLPYMKKLQSFYPESSDVAFLSICVDLEEKKEQWKNLIEERQLDGIQLFLPLKIGTSLENKFYLDSIKSFPTYLLVAKSGLILGKLPNTESNMMPYIIDRGLNEKYTSDSFEEAVTISETYKKWLKLNFGKFLVLRKTINKRY